MKKILGLMLVLLIPAQLTAATDVIFETNAQFEASQKARGEGLAAFRTGDYKGALAKMEEALTHRPGNTLLLGYIAFLAAETGNLKRAEEAALQAVAAGQTLGQGFQGKLAKKLDTDTWAALKEKLDTNVAAYGDAIAYARIPADIRLVEGIAVAPDGRTFVSSVVSGGLYAVAGDRAVQLVNAADHAMGSFFAIKYDSLNDSIFATYAVVEQTPDIVPGEGTTGIAEFDAVSGALKHNWVLDGPTNKHQIADLLITHDHRIYASDATGKAVYRIDGKKLVRAFDLPAAMSPQGLAELKGRLYLADYGRGLWLLDTDRGTASLLGRPKHINLIGFDGLTEKGGTLIAVQNGSNPHKLVAITLADDGKSVTGLDIVAQSLPDFDEPTLGVSTPSGYYFIAGSQWPKFGPEGTLREGATLKPTTILKLP